MTPPLERRFAWEGVSFDVPADWELAFHEKRMGVVRIRLEDDATVRLIGEWTTPPRGGPEFAEIHRRFENSSASLRKSARKSESLTHLPPGWSAAVYEMADDSTMGLTFYLSPQRDLFGVFEFHRGQGSLGEMKSRLLRFMAGFIFHPLHHPRPWRCYDLHFLSPPFFELEHAAFHAGLKQFTFTRSRRRLCLSFVSLADMALKRFQTPRHWALAALAADPRLPGPLFIEENDRIIARRRSFFGRYHYSEILRGCLHYHVRYQHDAAHNQLALLCYQYRRPSDLEWLAPLAGPFPPPIAPKSQTDEPRRF